jgi:hypothetical protein
LIVLKRQDLLGERRSLIHGWNSDSKCAGIQTARGIPACFHPRLEELEHGGI